MTKHTIECPVCKVHFLPDAQHRFSGTCSAICARKRISGGRTAFHSPAPDQLVIAKPAITRKPSTDRKAQTE